MDREVFCTTVIPTIGRASLARAAQSVLDQQFSGGDLELIVVNDSGKPLAEDSWQKDGRVRILSTQRRERCVARNSGAAVARGYYLHFLDDDDWMLPGAFQSFFELAQTSAAIWLYGGSKLVDRSGSEIIEIHHGIQGNVFAQVMAGEWIPLMSSLIRADDFFAVGGFNVHVLATEDVDLSRRIALRGDFAGMQAVVACLGMGAAGSTTDHTRASQYSRKGREEILDQPEVFPRMWDSATSSYWRGRVARVYLTSGLWNLKRRRFLTATSRTLYGLYAMLRSASNLASPDFWKALAKRYDSQTFTRGFQEASQPV